MPQSPLDSDVIALGIRQPWAELILRGTKTIEVRSLPTNVRGLIYIYTSQQLSDLPVALTAAAAQCLELSALPRGLLVGSVELHHCRPATSADVSASCVTDDLLTGKYAWELQNPLRFAEPQTVRFLPYGVWFYPFKRRGSRSPATAARKKEKPHN